MKTIIRKAIRLYQLILSPIFTGLGGSCRFHPSCSEFAVQAVETKPLGEATRLIAWRLLRCGPWTRGGIDLVPTVEKGKR